MRLLTRRSSARRSLALPLRCLAGRLSGDCARSVSAKRLDGVAIPRAKANEGGLIICCASAIWNTVAAHEGGSCVGPVSDHHMSWRVTDRQVPPLAVPMSGCCNPSGDRWDPCSAVSSCRPH